MAVFSQRCMGPHYVRMHRPRGSLGHGARHSGGARKFLRKYAAFTQLVIDEWLLGPPTESMRGTPLESMERRNVDGVLHPVSAERLTPAARLWW